MSRKVDGCYIGLDPGTKETGFVIVSVVGGVESLRRSGVIGNEEVIGLLKKHEDCHVVCEFFSNYGGSVGASTFGACAWAGRFWQVRPDMRFVRRVEVRLSLLGKASGSDAAIRSEIYVRYGGRASTLGIKSNPGKLYGIYSHAMSAFAVVYSWWCGAPEYDVTGCCVGSGNA